MPNNMRTISLNSRSRCEVLHVEAPGCIVNIHIGLTDDAGRSVTRVSISPDRYAGEAAWFLDPIADRDGAGIRVIQEAQP